jgi:tetratricopeptide (TPR) repeat protein
MNFKSILVTCILLFLCAGIVQPAFAGTEEIQDRATDFYNYGEVSIGNGQLAQAVEYFDQALAENTTLIASGDTLMYLYKDKSAALTDLGRYDEALTTVDAALIQFKNNPGLWNNKGYILFKQGRYDAAIEAYNQAISLDPSYEKGWINKASALYEAGRYQESVDAYKKVLAIDNESSDATAGLALAQKAAASQLPVTTIVLAVILIAAAGAAVWYVKFRKPETGKPSEKNAKKNRK